MAWTYTSLKQAIQDYIESDEDTLVGNLDVIIQQAEERILKAVPKLPAFRKNCTGSLTGNDQYLGIPADYLAPYSLAVDDNGMEFLLFKNVSFIRQAYPNVADATGVPKYYAAFSDDFFIVGPTPDQNYAVEIHYFYKPESIVTATTTWLGDNATNALFYGCLLEAYTFQKGDQDLMQIYNTRYDAAMANLAVLADPSNRTDEYRNG
jgi:hypothetical protein